MATTTASRHSEATVPTLIVVARRDWDMRWRSPVPRDAHLLLSPDGRDANVEAKVGRCASRTAKLAAELPFVTAREGVALKL